MLEVNNLNYDCFKNFSVSFNSRTFYSIIGQNNSGKSYLCSLLFSYVLTSNMITCNGILLNSQSRFMYLKNIGMVKRYNTNSFLFSSVFQELNYPLDNLGYSLTEKKEIIHKYLSYFQLNAIKNKKIDDLSLFQKQELLFILSLLHSPKVLLIDNALSCLKKSEYVFIKRVLKRIITDTNLTVINFTTNLEETLDSDYILIINNYKITKVLTSDELFDNDSVLIDNNLEIPFICDLTNKLKMYGILKKNYYDMESMVNDIWP